MKIFLKHAAILVVTVASVVVFAHIVISHAPLKPCEEVIAPLKALSESQKCVLIGRSGDQNYTGIGLNCNDGSLFRLVVITNPGTPIDLASAKEPRLRLYGKCQLNEKDRANIYTNERELNVEPGQRN